MSGCYTLCHNFFTSVQPTFWHFLDLPFKISDQCIYYTFESDRRIDFFPLPNLYCIDYFAPMICLHTTYAMELHVDYFIHSMKIPKKSQLNSRLNWNEGIKQIWVRASNWKRDKSSIGLIPIAPNWFKFIFENICAFALDTARTGPCVHFVVRLCVHWRIDMQFIQPGFLSVRLHHCLMVSF